MDTNHATNGGEGGGADLKRSELRVLERAIRKRFALGDMTYVEAPGEIERMATGKRQSPRTKIAAARVLVAMHTANMDQDKRDEGGETLNVNVNGSVSVDVFSDIAGYAARLRSLDRSVLETGSVLSNGHQKPVDQPPPNP